MLFKWQLQGTIIDYHNSLFEQTTVLKNSIHQCGGFCWWSMTVGQDQVPADRMFGSKVRESRFYVAQSNLMFRTKGYGVVATVVRSLTLIQAEDTTSRNFEELGPNGFRRQQELFQHARRIRTTDHFAAANQPTPAAWVECHNTLWRLSLEKCDWICIADTFWKLLKTSCLVMQIDWCIINPLRQCRIDQLPKFNDYPQNVSPFCV